MIIDRPGYLLEQDPYARAQAMAECSHIPEHLRAVAERELGHYDASYSSSRQADALRYLSVLSSFPFTATARWVPADVAAERVAQMPLPARAPAEEVLDALVLRERLRGRGLAGRGSAVGGAAGTSQLLMGPPGVGKSYLASQLSDVFEAPVARISLAGVDDVIAVRGVRRDYTGSDASPVVKALTEAGALNAIIVLDEIDKVHNGRGDPTAALLEVLDTSHPWRDDYLGGIDLDLSQVTWVATANSLSIHPALLDRFSVHILPAPSEEQRRAVVASSLWPACLATFGLSEQVSLSEDLVAELVKADPSAGYRGLERTLARLLARLLRHQPELLEHVLELGQPTAAAPCISVQAARQHLDLRAARGRTEPLTFGYL